MENLARYIIRASLSQERMQYLAEPSEVIYRAKDGTEEKVFDALEWLVAKCSHIPDRGEQMVRCYGYYSNVCRGKRKETEDDRVPCILEADQSSKGYRKNWARLIQKDLRGRSPDLPEVSGNHAHHRLHRRPGGHQSHPEPPGAVARQVKTDSQGPCPTGSEPGRLRASQKRPGSFLSTPPERRSPSSGPRLLLGRLPSVVSKDGSRRRKEPVCLYELQNGPRTLAEGLKTSPPQIHSQIPPNPC